MSTIPNRRGFYYAAEARLLLSQDHAIEVNQSVVTQNLSRDFRHQKKRTGLIDCDTSPPSRVWELDIESTHQFRENFEVRRDRELPRGTVTIAQAADALGVSRCLLHALVYSGRVPYQASEEGFRVVEWDWVLRARGDGNLPSLPENALEDAWQAIQREGEQSRRHEVYA